MSSEMLLREDLTAYIVAGLPKSFLSKVRKLAEAERANSEVIQLDEEMTEWLVAQLARRVVSGPHPPSRRMDPAR